MAVMQAPATIAQVWRDQLARLTEAGVPCCGQVADLAPPMVLVRPPDLVFTFGYGIDYAFTALAVAPNVGTEAALDLLSDLLITTQMALGGSVTAAFRSDVAGIDGADPAPGYTLSWTVTHRYGIPRRTR